MKKLYISGIIAAAGMFTGCSTQYDPVSDYSDVTEGITEDKEEIVFPNRASVESLHDHHVSGKASATVRNTGILTNSSSRNVTPTTHTPEP